MSNMSYCRFQNTLSDLWDCYYALVEHADMSKEEQVAANKLVALCRDIVNMQHEKDYSNDTTPLYTIVVEDAQMVAKDEIGRSLTPEEVQDVERYFGNGMGEHWTQIMECAIESAIKDGGQ